VTVDLVLDELARMNRIVHDLQTLTKATQPGFVRMDNVDLGGLLDELLVKANALGDRRWGLQIAGDTTVMLDRQRITQAMLQLSENAVRHTRQGDIIRIGGRLVGRDVEFFVSDSGPGIPPAERQSVTQRFTRGAGKEPDLDGAGLGLALVTAIAQAHHGRLVIGESDLGGADMRLVLPATRPSLVQVSE
jgi:signal transduction histidine kinase